MKRILRLLNRFGMGRAIALVLLVDLALLRIWDPLPVEALRLRTFDAYQLIAPRAATQRPVVIVDIDEDSLKALGQWPWPRTMVADMVTRVTQMGAAAIGFDVVFAEADRSSPSLAADTFHGLDEETRAKLKALPSNDAVFAEAIGNSRVVLGQTALAQASAVPADDLPQTGFAVVGVRGVDVEPPLLEFPGLLRNIPELENAAAGRGLFTIRPEPDGIVRRVPVVMLADGSKVPSLSVELLRAVSGAGAILIKMNEAGIQSVAFGRRGLEIPTDRRGQLWVHFSPHDKSRFVPAKDVLSGAADPARFKGKIVLVGTSAIGLLDLKTTPVDPTMPGVEVHAQLLESMLSGASLTSPSYATLAELATATLVSLGIIALAPVLGAWALFWVGGAMAALLVGLSWYFFAQRNLLIDFTFPLIASSLIYLTLVFTNYLRAHSERRQIRSAFGQYLSPALVEQLAQSPEKLVLGGEERVMTVLFSDVRGFTTISEGYKNDPQGLTTLMNRLLTPLTNAIVDRKGTIDKYIGDAIMAFWNAPLDDKQHQLHACEAAIDMLERIDVLNQERAIEAKESGQTFIPLNVGVGLNTGVCVVGNMGSDLRFDYSVLGDSVNLASRLEGQSKEYGFPIIVGSKTALAVKDKFAILELDFIMVKGKKEPEVIYAIAGREETAHSGRFQRLRNLTIEMLACYRNRDWDGALAAIARGRRSDEAGALELLYNLYEARIQGYQQNPPPADWNGAFALLTK